MVFLMSKKKFKPLESISIENFRGISDKREIRFNKDNNIVLLLGENGTGKSSFVNALEYMFKDTVDITPSKTLRAAAPIVHKGCKEDSLKIEMNFNNSYVRKTYKEPLHCDKAIRDSIDNSFVQNASFILNRTKILDFVDSSNGTRYEKLMKLTISKDYREFKDALSKSKYHYNERNREINKRLNKTYDDIESILNDITGDKNSQSDDEDKNIEILLARINNLLISINKEQIALEDDLKEYIDNLSYSEDEIIQKNNILKFINLYENLDFENMSVLYSDLIKNYENLSNQSNKVLKLQKSILANSKEYFNISSSNECPICGNSLDNEILNNIDSNLVFLNDALFTLEEWDKNYASFVSELNNKISIINEMKIYLNNPKEILIDDILNRLEDFIKDLERFNDFEISLSDLNEKYDFSLFKIQLENIFNEQKSFLDNISSFEKSLTIKNLKIALFRLDEYKQLMSDQKALYNKIQFTENLFKEFEDAKEDYVKGIMKKIWETTEEYYDIIHGEDLIKSPKIEVKGSKIALYLRAFDKDGDPRNYASEGHLDSLGICIFLAFMKEFNPIKFMVLDDILTTVDLSHKHQIARLIIENFDDFKILITTHNGLWAEQLQRIASSNETSVKILEIIDWNVLDGPIIRQKEDFHGKINNYLTNSDYNAAGNTARRYLEYILYNFASNKRNNVLVQLSSRYTVHDFFDNVLNRVSELAKGDLKEYSEYIGKELEISSFVGNKLSHDNKESYFLYGSDVIPFCYQVGELNRILNCVNCPHKKELKFDNKTKEVHCSESCKHKNNIFKDKSEIKRENIGQVF